METTKCLNCQKEVAQKKGKRAKLYCSDLCRATFHQKKKQGQDKTVFSVELPKDYLNFEKIMVLKEDGSMCTIDELQKTGNIDLWMQAFGALKQVTDDAGKPMFFEFKPNTDENLTAITSPVAGKSVTVTIPASALHPDYQIKTDMDRIKVLESEIKNPPAKLMIPKAMYISVRQKELSELKLKYNQ